MGSKKEVTEKYFLGSCAKISLSPSRFKPIHRIWIKAAHFIGRINTVIVLVLIYYGVITPTALLKRVFGGRPLPLKPDKKVLSYWVTRTEPVQPNQRFMKQF